MLLLDKYYTNPDIAEYCIKIFSDYIDINKNKDIIIEPSAGNGSFIPAIQKICNRHIFIDIAPEHPLIKKGNYLNMQIKDTNHNIYVIGNPPFGFKSSLAIKFIKKSCKFCNAFGFILPKSFANEYMQKSVPLNFHLVRAVHLPNNSFTANQVPYDVPAIFQVWKKHSYLRKKQQKMIPVGYTFVKKHQQPDFAIRRVGHKSGQIIVQSLSSLSSNSHYFVKLNDKSHINKIYSISPSSKYNVTGQMCISKRTIIKYINKMVKK